MKQSHNRIRACCVLDQKPSGPLSVLCDFQWQGHAGKGMDQEWLLLASPSSPLGVTRDCLQTELQVGEDKTGDYQIASLDYSSNTETDCLMWFSTQAN